MADQQVALERLRELYREKNEHLEKFLEPLEPYELSLIHIYMCIRDRYPVRAFRLGGPVELSRLLDYIPDSNGEQQRLEGLMRKSCLLYTSRCV